MFRVAAGRSDELVLHGAGEVLRLPRTPDAAARILACARVLARLAPLVPVAVPRPRLVGVTDDGDPFTAELRLPGVPVADGQTAADHGPDRRPDTALDRRGAGLPVGRLDAIAAGQRDGLLAGLAAIGPRQAREWGVPGDGQVLDAGWTLLRDLRRGVLTAAVGWDLQLV